MYIDMSVFMMVLSSRDINNIVSSNSFLFSKMLLWKYKFKVISTVIFKYFLITSIETEAELF